jgi:AraC-like DNA-binding protein
MASLRAGDWARYWRVDGMPVEAMHAHFTGHVYHRHRHESTPALAAAQAGFADQAHLTRWFHRYYGITPGAYRAAVQVRR